MGTTASPRRVWIDTDIIFNRPGKEVDDGLALIMALSNKTIDSFNIVFANGDSLDGEFQVASLEESGEHNGEMTYSVTLESASAWSFVRA